MPVRTVAISTVLRLVMGGKPYHFNNLPGQETATVDGQTMPREEFDRTYMDPIERIYERVVDSIDWNRVLLEATSRHIALEKDPEHDKRKVGERMYEDILCPECVCEALLADDTLMSWERTPTAPRYHGERPEALSVMRQAMRKLDEEDQGK